MTSQQICSVFSTVLFILLVGCDGVIGSPKTLDRCGVCGGNDSTCHVISGIFTRTRLPVGYNRVTSVPRGACNINVTELVVSPNYLAIRLSGGPYIVNGERDAIGASGEFYGAGTVFSYHRAVPQGGDQDTDLDQPAVETILAQGPLTSSIDIMVVQDQENRGIMYTYMIPTALDVATNSSNSSHAHHRVRHHHRRQSPVEGRVLDVPDTAAGEPPADQPINDVESPWYDADLAVDDHGTKQLYQVDSEKEDVSRTSGNHQRATASRRTHKKPRRHQRMHSSAPPSDQNDDPREPHDGRRTVETPGPAADVGDTVSARHSAAGTIPKNRRLQQVGVDFGLSDRPRYVPSGLAYGSQSQPYQAAGWPYGGQQVPPSYHQSAPPAVQQYPAAVGNPYQAARSPYVQPQPYYLPPVQQTAALAQSYDYYGAAAGAGSPRQRRRNNHQGSLLNDQWSVGGSTGGPEFDEDRDDDDNVTDYVWKIAGFSECSQSCGGGFQQTQVVCMKVTGTQVVVTDENCEPGLKPTVRTVTCSNTPCPPSWESSDWSECSTTCNRGQQTRTTECRQRVSPTLSIAVSASRCSNLQRPDTLRMCNDDRPCTRWKIGEWSQCSTECGRGQRTREVICVNVDDKLIAENKCDGSKPRMTEFCDMGSCARTWFFTNWTSECSNECGEGVYRREVHCSAEPQRCGEINRPKSEKPCKHERPCGGRWFAGPWSKCSVTCGEGVLLRDVVCVKKLGAIMAVVGDENCQQDDKPETEQDCEMDPCEPEWYTTEWSECSRSCDTGLQNREAKCLDADQLPSQSCDASSKPILRQTCNVHPCVSPAASITSSFNGSVSQSALKDSARGRQNRNHQLKPPQASCQDKFKNCRVVVQARLCRYAYYKDVCCFSCISHGYEPAAISQDE